MVDMRPRRSAWACTERRRAAMLAWLLESGSGIGIGAGTTGGAAGGT
jgi:hypothetical protein